MNCDNDETRETNKLYNPANIDNIIKKCDSDIPFEYSEREVIKEALIKAIREMNKE